MSDPQISQVSPTDSRLAAAVDVLAESFSDNPVTSRHLPDPDRRRRYMRYLTTGAVRDVARHGRLWVATSPPVPAAGGHDTGDGLSDAAVVGVLLVLPPGRFPISLRRRLRMLPWIGRAAWVARRAYPVLRRATADLRGTLPRSSDWWYVHTLAVSPASQHAGIGSLLLRHGLRVMDESGSPSYLHTPEVELVRLWQRFGYTTVGAPGHDATGAPYYTMFRPVAQHD